MTIHKAEQPNRMWNDTQDDEAEALLDNARYAITIRERLEPIINALIELGLIEMADTLTEVVDEYGDQV